MLRSTSQSAIRSRSTAKYLCIVPAGLIHRARSICASQATAPYAGVGRHIHRSTSQVYVHRLRRQYTVYTYASCFMCAYMHRVSYDTWHACVCVVLWPHDMNAHRLRPYPEPVKLRVTVRGLAYKNEVGFVFHSTCGKTCGKLLLIRVWWTRSFPQQLSYFSTMLWKTQRLDIGLTS